MLFFLALHDVAYPDTLETIVAAGELLTYPQLSERFDGGSFMDNLIVHAISAPDHASALEIVSALAEQI